MFKGSVIFFANHFVHFIVILSGFGLYPFVLCHHHVHLGLRIRRTVDGRLTFIIRAIIINRGQVHLVSFETNAARGEVAIVHFKNRFRPEDQELNSGLNFTEFLLNRTHGKGRVVHKTAPVSVVTRIHSSHPVQKNLSVLIRCQNLIFTVRSHHAKLRVHNRRSFKETSRQSDVCGVSNKQSRLVRFRDNLVSGFHVGIHVEAGVREDFPALNNHKAIASRSILLKFQTTFKRFSVLQDQTFFVNHFVPTRNLLHIHVPCRVTGGHIKFRILRNGRVAALYEAPIIERIGRLISFTFGFEHLPVTIIRTIKISVKVTIIVSSAIIRGYSQKK